MNAIEAAINRLEAIKKNITPIAIKIVKEDPKLLGDLNRGQLKEGITATGSSMPDYVRNSKAPKAPGAIKLFDTGDFTEGISPMFGSKEIDMTSRDRKVSFLDPKYPTALGLNDNSILVVQEKVKRELPPKILAL